MEMIVLLTLFTFLPVGCLSQKETIEVPWNFTFSPSPLTRLDEGDAANISITVSFANDTDAAFRAKLRRTNLILQVENLTPKHIEVTSDATIKFRVKDMEDGEFNAEVKVKGQQVGMGRLGVTLRGGGKVKVENSTVRYDVHVLLVDTIWNRIFKYGVLVSTVLNTVAFACCLDLEIVKTRFTRPWGIIIGFVFQYFFMPACSYAMGRLFSMSSTMAFGLLCMGCSPGGGASNMWTVLLHGEVDLSIAMTVISTTASLVMMPLWLFTLGRQMMIDIQAEVSDAADDVTVPFGLILITIALVGIPCLIGIAISHFLPRVGKILGKFIKPFALVFLLFQIVLGAYTKRYVFSYFRDSYIMIGCMLIPYSAMLASFTVAMICRQGSRKSRTIMVETSVQNMALAISVVFAALPHPEADIAIVAPVCAIFANPTVLVVLAVGFAIKDCIKRCRKRKQGPEVDDESDTISELFGENGIVGNGDFESISRVKARRQKALQDATKTRRFWFIRNNTRGDDADNNNSKTDALVPAGEGSRVPKEDDELAYGRHIASQLRQLPRISRQSLRIRIEALFLQEIGRQEAGDDVMARLETRYVKRRSQTGSRHSQGGSRLSLLGNVLLGIDVPPPNDRSGTNHRKFTGIRDRAHSTGSGNISAKKEEGRLVRPVSGPVLTMETVPAENDVSSRNDVTNATSFRGKQDKKEPEFDANSINVDNSDNESFEI